MADLRCYNPKCAAVLQESEAICPNCQSPQILNSIYRIRGILGGGGFGSVYDAIDTSLNNRRCAIKEIIARPPLLTRHEIEQEVHMLSGNAGSLPFMPDIYAYWHDGPKHYIAMQYIDGRTVSETRKLPWAPDEVLRFVREMLGHLVQMHALGVVHRDIKPANIKHTTRRGYVLLDFGLATQGSSTIIQGATPDYAPIEQFYEKRPADSYTDARSDLYSLAATAYYLLTNTKPTRADARAQGHPLQPPRHSHSIPPALAKTLTWMLELLPDQRPTSAQHALEQLNSSVEINAVPDVSPVQADDKVATTPGEPHKEPSNLVGEPVTPTTSPTHQGQRAQPDRGRLNDITWSPDGQRIAVASALGFSVYDLQEQQELFFEHVHTSVAKVAYTADGTALALSTASGILIVQSHTQQWLPTLMCSPSDIARAMASIPHSQILAIATEMGVELWKTGDTKPFMILGEEAISQIRFSAGGEWLAMVTPDGIKICDQHHGQFGVARVVTPTSAPVVDLAFSRDGAVLAIATAQEVSVWRTSDGSRVATPDAIKGAVAGIALSPDGKTVAVASAGQVSLWHIQPQRRLRTLVQSFGGIFRLEFAPNGEALAACSRAELRVWNVADGAEQLRRHDHLESMHSIVFSPDGQRLAAMGGRVYVWEMRNSGIALGQVLEGLSDQQNSVTFDTSGQWLAAASDASIRMWNVDTNVVVHEIPSGSAQAHGVIFTADQALLNVAADSVEWWHVGDATPAHTLPHLPDGSCDVAFAAGGQFLATFAGHTVTIRQKDGAVYRTLEIASEINSIALAPDGMRLAVATEDDTQIWSIKDATPQIINQRPVAAQRVIFAPNGMRLALLRDQIILLWQLDDSVSGQLLTFEGHTDIVHDVAFAPDGVTLASASQDGTVRLWMLEDPAVSPAEPPAAEQDDQPDTSFYVHIRPQKHPARLNVPSADTPSKNYASKDLPPEDHEVSLSPSQVHLTSSSRSVDQDGPSVLLHENLLYQYEVFEDLIMHKDYERLWGAFAHMPAGRYLLTGYGSFGGTSLIKCAMEKARDELERHGYNNGALLAIHFKVTAETADQFEVKADTITIGYRDLPEHLNDKAQWEALRAYAGQPEAALISEPLDLSLEDSLGITFFNMSDNTAPTVLAKTKDYDFAQFIDDLNSLFEQGGNDITMQKIIARFIGSKILSTRLIIVIDKVHYIETITALNKFNIFKSNRILLIVIAGKEDLDRWGESSLSLENMGFSEWYLPCLWGIDFDRLLIQVDTPQSAGFNTKVNIFRKYLEYSGRGSLGRIIAKLRDPKNTQYKAGSGLVDITGLCDRAEVRHNAWMQEVLEMNWDVILGDLFGGRHQDYRVDRAKMGVYYILDRISVNTLFTEEEILEEAINGKITISNNKLVVIETVQNILRVLTRNAYLRLEDLRYRMIWSKYQYQKPQRVPPLRRRRKKQVYDPRGNLNSTDGESQINLATLRQLLIDHFSDGELQNLCFDLGIDYDNLPAQGKAGKARELVAFTVRHSRTAELLQQCRDLRPAVVW